MIKAILWAIDGTLLNFEMSEKYAIRKCFEIFELGECTDEMLAQYSRINRTYWERLEKGELTKQEVLVGRFKEFFERQGLPVEKAEPFNNEYQVRLGDKAFYNDDGEQLVKQFKERGIKQYAVTNGTLIAQQRKLKLSGLDKLLDGAFISDVIGIEKPNIGFFDAVWKEIGSYEKDEVMIVGDSLTSDIQGGNNTGILCCWYNPQGHENAEGLRIEYEVKDLREIRKLT
ncbi:MAG: YjjG family noncanonical pyrimidine nucleotidase [Lachnospiraceae bacterium]|nr:YjjG family noncanonical pyrimidine nucleotidase [Lachnospiraceae bacterium]